MQGNKIYESLQSLLEAQKNNAGFYFSNNGIIKGSSSQTIDSEGLNGTGNSFGTQLSTILNGLGIDSATMSYQVWGKSGSNLNDLKPGELIIYYGPKVTVADEGKVIAVTAYDVAGKTYSTKSATVGKKKGSGTDSDKYFAVYTVN